MHCLDRKRLRDVLRLSNTLQRVLSDNIISLNIPGLVSFAMRPPTPAEERFYREEPEPDSEVAAEDSAAAAAAEDGPASAGAGGAAAAAGASA